jgi:hypothetical protein
VRAEVATANKVNLPVVEEVAEEEEGSGWTEVARPVAAQTPMEQTRPVATRVIPKSRPTTTDTPKSRPTTTDIPKSRPTVVPQSVLIDVAKTSSLIKEINDINDKYKNIPTGLLYKTYIKGQQKTNINLYLQQLRVFIDISNKPSTNPDVIKRTHRSVLELVSKIDAIITAAEGEERARIQANANAKAKAEEEERTRLQAKAKAEEEERARIQAEVNAKVKANANAKAKVEEAERAEANAVAKGAQLGSGLTGLSEGLLTLAGRYALLTEEGLAPVNNATKPAQLNAVRTYKQGQNAAHVARMGPLIRAKREAAAEQQRQQWLQQQAAAEQQRQQWLQQQAVIAEQQRQQWLQQQAEQQRQQQAAEQQRQQWLQQQWLQSYNPAMPYQRR